MFGPDHFSNNIIRWERHVRPFFEKRKTKKTNILMIRQGYGRAPMWLLENVFHDYKKTTIYCIDEYSPALLKQFKENFKSYADSVVHINVKNIHDGFLSLKDLLFDFVYIDGLYSQDILQSLVCSFPYIKPKGLIIVNNNTNSKEHLSNCPKIAIDAFMQIYASNIKALELSWQAIMLKRSKPLKLKTCRSEYYHEDLEKI